MGQPAVLRDPELRRVRALQMVERKIKNVSLADIAKEFNVHPDTVAREIQWVKNQNLFASYEDRIIEELIPTAIDTFRDAMRNGNVDVAEKVFKGMSMLLTPVERVAAPRADDDSLEVYVRQIRGGSSATSRPNRIRTGSAPAALPPVRAESLDGGDVLEGAIVTAEATASPVGADSDESRETDAQ